MSGSSIILNHVSVKLQGNDLLKDISFALQPGEHLAITGASGSGKTTLAKAIAGLIHVHGNLQIKWDESSSLQQKALLVEQRNQFKNLSHTTDFYYQQRFNSFDACDSETVYEALQNAAAKPDEAAIKIFAKKLGLYERLNAPLIQLSSGENKRFQLIKAILLQPQILILDSPFTGLDAAIRKQVNDILTEVTANGNQVIIITDVKQIPECITHVAVLKKGNLDNYIAKEDLTLQISMLSETRDFIDVFSLPVAEESEPSGNIIDMRNVHIQYGNKTILNDINWRVKEGEKWHLKGHNGAGKSTLLSLINGDNPQAYSNEIYLFGKRRGTGESIWDIKSKIGYVSPELHAFYDKQTTCYHTISSGFFDTIGLFRKLSRQQDERVQKWIDLLNLQSVQYKALAALPFSTQRMILIARALVKNPALFILDEPCQGLDDDQRETLVELINNLSEHFNKTLIYVSHYDNEVPCCITNVLELTSGNQKIYHLKTQTEFA